MKPRGEIPIIICCAEDDEAVLAKVVDELRREGLAPELVPGIEFDPNLLTAAVDVAAADALFVLCGSAALDKAAIRRLTGLFSARSGPGQRIISTQFSPSRPLAVLPAIRGALKEMRMGEPRSAESGESSGSHLRDVVEAFADPEPPPRGATETRPRPAPDPRRDEVVTAPPVTSLPARSDATRDRSPVPARTSAAATAAAPSPAPVVRPPALVAPSPVAAAASAVPQPVVDEGARSLEHRLSGVPAMPDSMVSTDPNTSATRLPRVAAGASSTRAPVFDEPRGNRLLLVFAGVGIAGILALALMQLLQPGPDRDAPARASEPPRKADVAKAPVGADKPQPRPTKAVEPPPPSEPVEPPPSAPVEPPPSEPVEPPPSDEPPPSVDVPPAPKPVSKRDVDLAALDLAHSEGKVHRLGSLWVARGGDGDDNTWEDAQRRCHGKRINGVQGFRLPGVRELRKIRGAKVITSGTYWSRDKGTAGDEAIAFDAATGGTAVYLTVEPNGRALCVRVL